jgi:hypothetical protein
VVETALKGNRAREVTLEVTDNSGAVSVVTRPVRP